MKAVMKYNEAPYELSIKELPKPSVQNGEVLVNVSSVGICGSDVHMYAGHAGYDWIPYPLTLGHEITGTVVETSHNTLQGQRVVINPYVPCGECEYCKRGEENRCDNNNFFVSKRAPLSLQYGFRQNGGMAEFIAVPEKNVVPISDDVSDNVAAVSEAIAVGLTAVDKAGTIAGKKVIIFGPGPIGLSVASLLVGLRAENIIMAGVPGDEKRLEKAEEIGVHHTLVTSDNLVNDLLGWNNGYDVVFDCSGHHSVPGNAAKVLKKGGQLVLVGISTNTFSLEMDQIVRGEIQVRGSYGITWDTFKRTLEYATDDAFPFERLVTGSYGIERAKEAFDAAMDKAAGKIVLKMNA
ncbi:alcohol dehydrogenase catalytic domain-containing protein [Virgibacillus sp. NKC19-3]|uniref:zinc-dependent alcohol dehydrogenase n=1 Tax=Virgibacillus saliphilus TaxID=2831674 RepID=UPI001C9A4286|nr:alcohol dehydrogenase catalytic domain-containing protein [Virgibacillus sp. NKC19-3]MBY7144537.1 alcohol dehydrogenase catalytic domain-containing protein [Virgibacillus sp. NKC19-3]